MHFCLSIRQLTELWIWDHVTNGWPLFRCTVLFMFAVRLDSWTSNPSIGGCESRLKVTVKETIRTETVMFCTARWEDLHSPLPPPFFLKNQVRVHGESPSCLSVKFKLIFHVVQDRCCMLLEFGDRQQVDIAGRWRYDSPKLAGCW